MIRCRPFVAAAAVSLAVGCTSVGAAPTANVCAINRPTFKAGTETALLARQRGADYWTGRQITASQSQIDHVLPWCWALRHGLTVTNRVGFYRDRDNLVATAAAVNNAKSDQPPWGTWRPAITSRRCDQARIFEVTAQRWSLNLNPAERSALGRILEGCPR